MKEKKITLKDLVIRPGELLIIRNVLKAKTNSGIVINSIGDEANTSLYDEHPIQATVIKRGALSDEFNGIEEGSLLLLRTPGIALDKEGHKQFMWRMDDLVVNGKHYNLVKVSEVLAWIK